MLVRQTQDEYMACNGRGAAPREESDGWDAKWVEGKAKITKISRTWARLRVALLNFIVGLCGVIGY